MVWDVGGQGKTVFRSARVWLQFVLAMSGSQLIVFHS